MKKLILIFCLILFLSCKNKERNMNSQKENTINSAVIDKNDSNKKEEVPIHVLKDCNKSFEDFFKQFSRDSIFQKNRVKYPLQYLVSDYDYTTNKDTIGVELIQRRKYNYLDFTIDKGAMNNEYDKYTVETKKINGNTIHYMHLGYDNGIQVTYKFKLIEGCWYMVEILDEST